MNVQLMALSSENREVRDLCVKHMEWDRLFVVERPYLLCVLPLDEKYGPLKVGVLPTVRSDPINILYSFDHFDTLWGLAERCRALKTREGPICYRISPSSGTTEMKLLFGSTVCQFLSRKLSQIGPGLKRRELERKLSQLEPGQEKDELKRKLRQLGKSGVLYEQSLKTMEDLLDAGTDINAFADYKEFCTNLNDLEPGSTLRPLDALVLSTNMASSGWNQYLDGVLYLIENGLMNFGVTDWPWNARHGEERIGSSLLHLLRTSPFGEKIVTVADRFLSLGFGRVTAPIKTAPFETADPKLDPIREYLKGPSPSWMFRKGDLARDHAFNEMVRQREERARELLKEIVTEFKKGPLCLKEQSRNAVRLALGGVRFRSRAQQLPLPTIIKNFVILPVQLFPDLKLKPDS